VVTNAHTDDGGGTFLRNVGDRPQDQMTSHPTRPRQAVSASTYKLLPFSLFSFCQIFPSALFYQHAQCNGLTHLLSIHACPVATDGSRQTEILYITNGTHNPRPAGRRPLLSSRREVPQFSCLRSHNHYTCFNGAMALFFKYL
jgi:hypothetical protein